MSQRSLREATITIKDGTAGTQKSVVLKVGDGNFSFSEKRTIEYFKDRGKLSGTREGEDNPVDVSFDFIWDWMKASNITTTGASTIRDLIKGIGCVSAGADCEPYACDIEVVLAGEICSETETITLTDFRYESLDFKLKEGQVSCSGKCNITGVTIA